MHSAPARDRTSFLSPISFSIMAEKRMVDILKKKWVLELVCWCSFVRSVVNDYCTDYKGLWGRHFTWESDFILRRKKGRNREKTRKKNKENYNKWPQCSSQMGLNWRVFDGVTPSPSIFLKSGPLQMRQSGLTNPPWKYPGAAPARECALNMENTVPY